MLAENGKVELLNGEYGIEPSGELLKNPGIRNSLINLKFGPNHGLEGRIHFLLSPILGSPEYFIKIVVLIELFQVPEAIRECVVIVKFVDFGITEV
jgi:hypothetical protein